MDLDLVNLNQTNQHTVDFSGNPVPPTKNPITSLLLVARAKSKFGTPGLQPHGKTVSAVASSWHCPSVMPLVSALCLILVGANAAPAQQTLSAPSKTATNAGRPAPQPVTMVETSPLNGGSPGAAIDQVVRQSPRPRIGLALGGGGARGAAHVGVLRVLEQEGIPIDCIAGTSMGSVVGGLFAAGVPLPQIEQQFVSGRLMGAYITIPLSVRLAATPIFYVPRVFGLRPLDGMYRGKKFAAFLNASLPPAEREMANFKIPFGAVVLNIVDGQVQTLRKGDFAQAIEASSAVPMLRKPVRINGQLFIDGGVCANVPVTQAREMGADIVIAVDVDERFNPMALDKLTDTGTVMHRVLTLNLAKADEAELHAADIVIHPNVDGIGLIDSREQDMRAAICAGEDAARNALPGIKARLGAVGITLRRPGGPSPTRVAGPNQTEY